MVIKGFREGFFGALSYGALILAAVPFVISLMCLWAAVGSERFNAKVEALKTALGSAARDLEARRAR